MLALYLSLRSPYARRVRVLLSELGIPADLRFVDVHARTLPPDFLAHNPLGRVPTLVLTNGQALMESHLIETYLRDQYPSDAMFNPQTFTREQAMWLSALSTGIIDYTIEAFLEGQRPNGMRDEAGRQQSIELVRRAVAALAPIVQNSKGPYLDGDRFGLWDVNLGCALGYAEFRIGRYILDEHPSLRSYFDRLSQRPSFAESVPVSG